MPMLNILLLGYDATIDAAILIADVAGRSDDVRRRQRRIETLVAGDREQVLRLHVDSALPGTIAPNDGGTS